MAGVADHSGLHPWLSQFQSEPAECLEDFLRGAAHIPPHGLADPADVTIGLWMPAKRQAPSVFALLDEHLLAWFTKELARPPEYRAQYGLGLYARKVRNAFLVVQLLVPERTLAFLDGPEPLRFRQWAADVRQDATCDTLAAYYRVLAAHPRHGRRHENLFLQMVDNVGRGIYDEQYLAVALSGLDRLPSPPGSGSPEADRVATVMVGLATWARYLKGESGQRDFLGQWQPLHDRYALPGSAEWMALLRPIWTSHLFKDCPFVGWWRADLASHGADHAAKISD